MASQPAASNGNNLPGMNAMAPVLAGQQMDVNVLYQKVVELSELLRENRERTAAVVNGAEELAVSCRIFLSCSHSDFTDTSSFGRRRTVLTGGKF